MSEGCTVSLYKDLIVVKLHGDLDHHVTEQIREKIDRSIKKERIPNLVFDFRDVGFMDSSGIGLLMGRYRMIKGMDGVVYVSNLGYAMQRIFRLSGLYQITKHSLEIDHIVNEEVTYE